MLVIPSDLSAAWLRTASRNFEFDLDEGGMHETERVLHQDEQMQAYNQLFCHI